MPQEFVVNMRNSLSFKDYVIEQTEKLLDLSFDLNQVFKTAYDLETNSIHFYSLVGPT